jgi:hypothetical protein
VKYYDLRKNWRKVKRHIGHPDVQRVLVRDFNRYTYGRWREKFKPGMVPTEFESCDWQLKHRGRRPAFWQFTKHRACHWLCNFSLRLAQRVEPKKEWRIITSEEHSTVWDGEGLLFDFNFQAMGYSPKECFSRANQKELKPGELLKVYMAEHWRREVAHATMNHLGGGT